MSKLNTSSDVEPFVMAEKLKGEWNHNYKLKKLPPPSFIGNIRLYLRFRNDFKELVLPCLATQQAAYAL